MLSHTFLQSTIKTSVAKLLPECVFGGGVDRIYNYASRPNGSGFDSSICQVYFHGV